MRSLCKEKSLWIKYFLNKASILRSGRLLKGLSKPTMQYNQQQFSINAYPAEKSIEIFKIF